MKNRFWPALALLALAGTLVLLIPEQSQAQRGGRRGGGVSVGVSTPYFSGYYSNAPNYGGYGGYGYGGYGNRGYGTGGYGYGNPYGYGYGRGISIGIGTGYPYYGSGYGYGYGSSNYYGSGYSYAPSYAYNYPTTDYQSFYPPDSGYSQQPTGNIATIRVMVPADAQLWFDKSPTQQRGPMREFQTPPLDPNRTFTYELVARWNENGAPMERTRSVQVQAGRTAVVDFNTPEQGQQQQQPLQQKKVQQPPIPD